MDPPSLLRRERLHLLQVEAFFASGDLRGACIMALPFSSPSDLDEMLARVRRFEMALHHYRASGSTDQANTMRLVIALEQSLIRRHCATHRLELPEGIPAAAIRAVD